MAKQLAEARPIAIKTVSANRFQIPMYSMESPDGGPRLTVHLNAMLRGEELRSRAVENPDYSAEAAAKAAATEEPYDVPAMIDEDYTDTIDRDLTNLDPEVFTGDDLDALFEAAYAHAKGQEQIKGVTRGAALRRGLKLAMYDALEQRGRIPSA